MHIYNTYVYIYVYIYIYTYIYTHNIHTYAYVRNHGNNLLSRLSLQWPCGNSCTWAHDVRLYKDRERVKYLVININHVCIHNIYIIYIYIYTYILCIHTKITLTIIMSLLLSWVMFPFLFKTFFFTSCFALFTFLP